MLLSGERALWWAGSQFTFTALALAEGQRLVEIILFLASIFR